MSLRFGQSGDALVGIDENGTVVLWNSAAVALLGRSEADALGRPCHEVLAGRTPSGSHLCMPGCAIQKSCAQFRAPRRFEIVIAHPDGTDLWLDAVTCVVADERGRPVALHLLCESVAARHLKRIADGMKRDRAPSPQQPTLPAVALTGRERDVLRLLARGLRTAGIAEELQLAPATVRNHIGNLLQKLGAHSRAEAVVLGLQRGLVHLT
ncbi:MAG: LuxR C-terminal-related transcriptional regulator [Candidatus Baltobacteraceae bacterium]